MRPAIALCCALLLGGCDLPARAPAPPSMARAIDLPGVRNAHRVGRVILAGSTGKEGIEAVRALGADVVINCRMPAELDWDEQALVESLGMRYVALPFVPSTLDDALVARFFEQMDSVRELAFVHCASANRISALWAMYEIDQQGIAVPEALQRARRTGMHTEALFDFVRGWAARRSAGG